MKEKDLDSRAPAAMRSHIPSYRTLTFIFSWSSSSAAYFSWARMHDDVSQHGAHTGQPRYMHTKIKTNLMMIKLSSC